LTKYCSSILALLEQVNFPVIVHALFAQYSTATRQHPGGRAATSQLSLPLYSSGREQQVLLSRALSIGKTPPRRETICLMVISVAFAGRLAAVRARLGWRSATSSPRKFQVSTSRLFADAIVTSVAVVRGLAITARFNIGPPTVADARWRNNPRLLKWVVIQRTSGLCRNCLAEHGLIG